MKTQFRTIDDLVSNGQEGCPLPIDIIPNNMGINLCSVDSVMWTRQEDGQLVSLIINFLPENK